MTNAHNSGRHQPAIWRKTCNKTWVGEDRHRHACILQPNHATGKHLCDCGEEKKK
jgi:hypothetical protein